MIRPLNNGTGTVLLFLSPCSYLQESKTQSRFCHSISQNLQNNRLFSQEMTKKTPNGSFLLVQIFIKAVLNEFSGQASDGTIHTDQGKRPDRQKQQLPFIIIRSKIRKELERERNKADDEPR